jgi:hypothetical protein
MRRTRRNGLMIRTACWSGKLKYFGSNAGHSRPPVGQPCRATWPRRYAPASAAIGEPLSRRAIAERFGISRRKASQLTAEVTMEGNGHVLARTEA